MNHNHLQKMRKKILEKVDQKYRNLINNKWYNRIQHQMFNKKFWIIFLTLAYHMGSFLEKKKEKN
jgi:hypothetical protein